MKILEIDTLKRRIGNLGERLAAKHLRREGYKILEKNFVADGYEIDIIAIKDNTVAFVEVKARTVGAENPMEPRPASAVTKEKQQKIIKAASYYRRRRHDSCRARFDIIEVYLEKTKTGRKAKEIKHLIGAFDLNTAYAGGKR